MEEHHKDLIDTQQRRVLNEIVAILSSRDPDSYYLSTIEIASLIKAFIEEGEGLTKAQFEIVASLSRYDIQMLLSIHK
ncbi:MAG: hypothetical protein AAF197_06985 [Pseudomonadota bacterium]